MRVEWVGWSPSGTPLVQRVTPVAAVEPTPRLLLLTVGYSQSSILHGLKT